MPENEILADVIAAQEAANKVLASSPNTNALWNPQLVQFLSVLVLGFTCVALLLSSLLLYKRDATPQQILRVFGVLTIVGMATLLLVAGYSNDQLTPIVGLFGAIAGYLLGKETGSVRPKNE